MTTEQNEIDYTQIPSTEGRAPISEWEPPPHKYFGPKNPQTGRMLPEPVYVHQTVPVHLYSRVNGRVAARIANTDEEKGAMLAAGWVTSPAELGVITAPSFEQRMELIAQAEKRAALEADLAAQAEIPVAVTKTKK